MIISVKDNANNHRCIAAWRADHFGSIGVPYCAVLRLSLDDKLLSETIIDSRRPPYPDNAKNLTCTPFAGALVNPRMHAIGDHRGSTRNENLYILACLSTVVKHVSLTALRHDMTTDPLDDRELTRPDASAALPPGESMSRSVGSSLADSPEGARFDPGEAARDDRARGCRRKLII